MEEKESPVRATPVRPTASGTCGKLKISVPNWTSEKQAVAVSQRYTFLDSDSDATNDTTGEHIDYEADDDDKSSWNYESSTTLVGSDYSRPGSAINHGEAAAALSFPPRTSSLLPPDHRHESNDTDASARCPTKKLPLALHSTNVLKNSRTTDKANYSYYSYNQGKVTVLRRTESLPVLFPSPSVEDQPQGTRQPLHRHVGDSVGSQNAFDVADLDPRQKVLSHPAPQITIQAPSPVKGSAARKRAPSSSSENHFQLPLAQRVRRNDAAGLPLLTSDEEPVWKADFPGNTPALLTILLTWSHTMWTFYNRLPDPKRFSTHLAFPSPIAPPTRKQLLSVGFYDTSTELHKEVRFLGPGDAAEISYHEVDVFGGSNSTNSQPPPRCSSPVDAIRQTLRLAATELPKHTRYTSMADRAKTGEGRWCYVLIKGNPPADGETPPHVVLVWHGSAVTATSDCLHTIYPDGATPFPVAPLQEETKLKRFSSLQNLGQALRDSLASGFHHTLRSMSSCSELPAISVAAVAEVERQGGMTLHRTVLKLEKAGCIPLIEGYRVDVAAFREWMEACGRGKGKVIMWREKDIAICGSDRSL